MTLNILENYDFGMIEHGSFEYYHLLIEALKLSFSDCNKVLTDPEFSQIPLGRLLDKEYARELAAKSDCRRFRRRAGRSAAIQLMQQQ